MLDIIGLLIRPQNGRVLIDEKEQLSEKDIRLSKRHRLGYIFQNYALLQEETVKNNLMLATKYNYDFQKSDLETALNKVGLSKEFLKKKYTC